jgi:hypothetical protein
MNLLQSQGITAIRIVVVEKHEIRSEITPLTVQGQVERHSPHHSSGIGFVPNNLLLRLGIAAMRLPPI